MFDSAADVLVIGAGPAGASTAIWLANAGWKAVLVEQHRYPRRKVCGECVAPGNVGLLDDLGVGAAFRRMAGPQLKWVGWMGADETVIANLPRCLDEGEFFGQALGRDRLDELLLIRAKALGVTVLQPARVLAVRGEAGRFECDIEWMSNEARLRRTTQSTVQTLQARVVVDAHGSWGAGRELWQGRTANTPRPLRRDSDLFAFKASFLAVTLDPGLLPVIAFDGGYGGIVMSDRGAATLACCIRRDILRVIRAALPGASAGEAVEAYLRQCCRGIREALADACRDGSWLSVGPLKPGIRIDASDKVFRVGNAAGEAHPLIGEGMSMAFQSAALLTGILTQHPVAAVDACLTRRLQRHYVAAWRADFSFRLRLAALYAHVAMRPALASSTQTILRHYPSLLTAGARLAGKARCGVSRPELHRKAE